MSWQPLLGGALGVQADEVVRAFASSRPEGLRLRSASLASGSCGAALFWANLAVGFDLRGARALCERAIELTFESLDEHPADCSLFGGLAGVGWGLLEIHRLGLMDFPEEVFASIDPVLLERVQRPWDRYELIYGMAGIGVLALARLPGAWADQVLSRIVEQLAARATHDPDGVTWLTPVGLLEPEEAARFPRGTFNLGLAHGMPAVVSLLARCAAAGVREELARPLARAGASWLLARRQRSSFPSRWMPDRPGELSREAWCYGNPGVGIALLSAARALGDVPLEREAVAVLRDAAVRPPAETGVQDASLCHGSAGLAHILNRAYQATGEPCFRDAAVAWFRDTLERVRREQGEVHFDAYVSGRGPDGTIETSFGPCDDLLLGGGGAGLALLSALSSTSPRWDQFLMTDVGPGGGQAVNDR